MPLQQALYRACCCSVVHEIYVVYATPTAALTAYTTMLPQIPQILLNSSDVYLILWICIAVLGILSIILTSSCNPQLHIFFR
jgi:hypothetical protein